MELTHRKRVENREDASSRIGPNGGAEGAGQDQKQSWEHSHDHTRKQRGESDTPRRRPRKMRPIPPKNEEDDHARRIGMSEAVHQYTCGTEVLQTMGYDYEDLKRRASMAELEQETDEGETESAGETPQEPNSDKKQPQQQPPSDQDIGLSTYRALRDSTARRKEVLFHDEVQINIPRTLKIFLYHVCYPLSMPVMMLAEDREFMRATRFWGCNLIAFTTAHFIPLILITLNIVILSVHIDPTWAELMTAEVVMVDFYYVFRILLIAIKYGYMPDDDYETIEKGPSKEGLKVNRRSMLITGWLNPGLEDLIGEVRQAEGRKSIWLKDADVSCSCELIPILPELMGYSTHQQKSDEVPQINGSVPDKQGKSVKNPLLDKDEEKAKYDPQHKFWMNLPAGIKRSIDCADGSVLLDAETLVVSLWCRNRQPPGMKILNQAVAGLVVLFRIATPLLVIKLDSADDGFSSLRHPVFSVATMISLMFCGFVLQYTMLSFIVIAVIDYLRRFQSASMVTTLTKPTRVRLRNESRFKELKLAVESGMLTVDVPTSSECSAVGEIAWFPPVIDVCWPENVYSWYRIRAILRDIGYRFALRLQLYLGLVASILIVLNILIVIQLFSEGTHEFFESTHNLMFSIEVAFVTLFFMASIVAIILVGALSNGELTKQEDSLLQAVLKLEQLARKFSLEGRDKLRQEAESCIRTLNAVREVVRIQDTNDPVQVLGLQASPALLQAVATGSATLIATVSNRLQTGGPST